MQIGRVSSPLHSAHQTVHPWGLFSWKATVGLQGMRLPFPLHLAWALPCSGFGVP